MWAATASALAAAAAAATWLLVLMYRDWQWLIPIKKSTEKSHFKYSVITHGISRSDTKKVVLVHKASIYTHIKWDMCYANECLKEVGGKFKCSLRNVTKNNVINNKFDLFYMHILYRYDKIHDVQPMFRFEIFRQSVRVCRLCFRCQSLCVRGAYVFDPFFSLSYFDAHFSGKFDVCHSLIRYVWQDKSLRCVTPPPSTSHLQEKMNKF